MTEKTDGELVLRNMLSEIAYELIIGKYKADVIRADAEFFRDYINNFISKCSSKDGKMSFAYVIPFEEAFGLLRDRSNYYVAVLAALKKLFESEDWDVWVSYYCFRSVSNGYLKDPLLRDVLWIGLDLVKRLNRSLFKEKHKKREVGLTRSVHKLFTEINWMFALVDNKEKLQSHPYGMKIAKVVEDEMDNLLKDGTELERLKFLGLIEGFARETKKRDYTDEKWQEVLDKYLEEFVRRVFRESWFGIKDKRRQ